MTQATDTQAPADPAVLNLRRMALRTAGEVVELRQQQAADRARYEAELKAAVARFEAAVARLGEADGAPDAGGT